jgi:Tfp pilus assembly protein PilF
LIEGARILSDVGKTKLALSELQAALKQHGDDQRLRCELAVTYLRSGRASAALAEADSALISDPDAAWPLRLRCAALLRLGRPADALQAAERAARSDTSPDAQCDLVEALLASGRLNDAGARVSALLESHPENARAHRMRALTALANGDWSEAERCSRVSLRGGRSTGVDENNLAIALWAQGRAEDAARSFATAVAEARTTRNVDAVIANRARAGLGKSRHKSDALRGARGAFEGRGAASGMLVQGPGIIVGLFVFAVFRSQNPALVIVLIAMAVAAVTLVVQMVRPLLNRGPRTEGLVALPAHCGVRVDPAVSTH